MKRSRIDNMHKILGKKRAEIRELKAQLAAAKENIRLLHDKHQALVSENVALSNQLSSAAKELLREAADYVPEFLKREIDGFLKDNGGQEDKCSTQSYTSNE